MPTTAPPTVPLRTNPTPFTCTVLGYPRIGPARELKKVLERHWAGHADRDEVRRTAAELSRADRSRLHAAGLDSVPVNTFSLYDQVLDTAVLLGAVPARFTTIPDDWDRYFAMARGTDALPPLEMTKWFDTNYHYLVPEIAAGDTFTLHPDAVLADLRSAVAEGIPARPVLLGPVSFLLLAKSVGRNANLLDRVRELVPLYRELLALLADAGATWVQLDEPALVLDRTPDELDTVGRVYRELVATERRPAILVAGYFGDLGPALPVLAGAGVDGLALDLVSGALPAAGDDLGDTFVVAGVVDGRNVWRTDPDRALAALAAVDALTASDDDRPARDVAVSTSCSLLHVPYSLAAEPALDPQLRSWLAFADEKVAEVVALAQVRRGGADTLAPARAAVADRAATPRVHRSRVTARLASLRADAFQRGDEGHRRMVQASRYALPKLPTTTIGSFPQTPQLRAARAGLRAGTIDEAAYNASMRREIADVIALQEEIGLDVLVHGEPERNDMVQYFAERLDGFVTTDNGWVQSYGSRCVRPPILFGDVQRPAPITVTWTGYAQSLTDKPVKGMLTGPVTILAWSFVRDDQPLATTALQVALAIRDETVDLQNAGIGIIQVDEPALRELLPPRRADQPGYLEWAVRAFRLATSGVTAATAIHTHLCYSEFGAVIGAIADLGADVTSVEAARSHMEILDDLTGAGYSRGIGPGVYDIHSPRVPGTAEIRAALDLALTAVPADRLWVNPDCGLKTRRADEATPALRHLVDAARDARASLS